MERKVIKEENIGGVHTVIETVEQTREDGFVPETEIHKIGNDRRGKYHYGASKHYKIITNNPNVARPFVYGVSMLFFIIGVVISVVGNPFFGSIFAIAGIYSFIHFKKEIDKVEEEIRQQGGSVIESSAIEDWKELGKSVKEGYADASKSVFTKDNFKWFSKLGLCFGGIISLITSVIVGIVAGLELGMFIFVICVLAVLLYLFIMSKLFKH